MLLVISFTFLSHATNAQQIKLMSYNIGSSHWSTTKDSVIARILANDPDVFCAIEATGNTRPFVESSLTDYNMLQTFGNDANICESHIFYRKNMFSIMDSGFVEMDTYGGYTGPGRYVNWARLEETSSQNQFLVFASHILFVFPNNLDSSSVGQYRHADGMVQLMNQHAALNIPMITVGDFNADSSSAVMQFLDHQISVTFNTTTITNPIDLDDSWYVANPSTQKPGTVGMGDMAVDWILTTPNTGVVSALIDDQGSSDGVLPSDHKPLQITFDLGTTTTSFQEFSNTHSLSVYPNPFQNHIIFDFGMIDNESLDLEIFDIGGSLVHSATDIRANKSTYRVDGSSLNNGIYVYMWKSPTRVITGRIIRSNDRN